MRAECWYCQAVRWRWLMARPRLGGAWWCRNSAACLRRYDAHPRRQQR